MLIEFSRFTAPCPVRFLLLGSLVFFSVSLLFYLFLFSGTFVYFLKYFSCSSAPVLWCYFGKKSSSRFNSPVSPEPANATGRLPPCLFARIVSRGDRDVAFSKEMRHAFVSSLRTPARSSYEINSELSLVINPRAWSLDRTEHILVFIPNISKCDDTKL